MQTSPDTLIPTSSSGRNMRLVSREWLVRSVAEAVERTLLEFTGLAPTARHRLRDEVVQRFGALTQGRARRVRGLTRAEVLRDFERTHQDLVASRERARHELTELELRLGEARQEVANPTLDAAQATALDRALEEDVHALLQGPNPRSGVAGLVRREGLRRAHALTLALAPERERAEVLERRVAKLRGELERLERSLVDLEHRLAVDDGVASIYKDVQGLDAEAAARESKLGLLQQIFQANVELQLRARGQEACPSPLG